MEQNKHEQRLINEKTININHPTTGLKTEDNKLSETQILFHMMSSPTFSYHSQDSFLIEYQHSNGLMKSFIIKTKQTNVIDLNIKGDVLTFKFTVTKLGILEGKHTYECRIYEKKTNHLYYYYSI